VKCKECNREVSPELDAAIEKMVEALKEITEYGNWDNPCADIAGDALAVWLAANAQEKANE
jgi:hypothetical protein